MRPDTGSLTMDARKRLRSIDPVGSDGVAVRCGSATHRLRVRGCELVLDDHDPLAEAGLVAFGAGLPDCLVYYVAWQEAFDDEGFIAAWAGTDYLAPHSRISAREEWDENYWEAWPSEPAAAVVLFDGATRDHLGVEVAKRAAAVGSGRWLQLAAAAVRVRVRGAFVDSLESVEAHRRPDALVPLVVRVDFGGGVPRARGRLAEVGSSVTLDVQPSWLWHVWAAGLSTVGGCFVLDRREGSEGGAGGDVVRLVHWAPTGRAHREHHPVVADVPLAAPTATVVGRGEG